MTTTLTDRSWSADPANAVTASDESSPSWMRRIGFTLVALLVFGVGSGIVFHNLSIGHALYGLTEYDDGVYFGATMHFVAGQLPYRSFAMVQPPGITLLLAPVALIVGQAHPRTGLAIARVLTGAFVGLDALLIAFILRYKGMIAALVGGMLFAIYPPLYSSDHTLMLEPYLIFFCLFSVALAFRAGKLASDRRLMLAGVALGFAGAIKLFAAAIAVAFLFLLLFRHRRELRMLITGAIVGFVIPCLPFFIGAPHAFIHEVFSSQLTRTTAVPSPFQTRLVALVGLQNVANPRALAVGPHSPWPWLGGALLATVTLLGVLIPTLKKRADSLIWFAFFGAIFAFAMVCIPQQFYTHYVALPLAFFALVVGGAVGSFVVGARAILANRKPANDARARRSTPLGIVLGWIAVIVFFAASATVIGIETNFQKTRIIRFGDPGRSLDRAIPAGNCVISDAASLLVVANRMNFSPSCPVMVDSTGTWLSYDAANPPRRNRKEPKDPELVALWQRLFSHADYTVFAGKNAFRVPFTPALSQWFNDHFQIVPDTAPITFVKRAKPISHAPIIAGVVP